MENSNVDFYKVNINNKHTRKATWTWLRTYQRWAGNNNEAVEIRTIENAVELNRVLELFFSNRKRLDDTPYLLSVLSVWLQYRFIFLVFCYCNNKKTRKINPILHPHPCVNVYLLHTANKIINAKHTIIYIYPMTLHGISYLSHEVTWYPPRRSRGGYQVSEWDK